MDTISGFLYITVSCSLAALPLEQIVVPAVALGSVTTNSPQAWTQTSFLSAGARAHQTPSGGPNGAAAFSGQQRRPSPEGTTRSRLPVLRYDTSEFPPARADVRDSLRTSAADANGGSPRISGSPPKDSLRPGWSPTSQTPRLGRGTNSVSPLQQKSYSRTTNGLMLSVHRDVSSKIPALQESHSPVTREQAPLQGRHLYNGPPLPQKSYSRPTNGLMLSVHGDVSSKIPVLQESHSPVTREQAPLQGRLFFTGPPLPQKSYSRPTNGLMLSVHHDVSSKIPALQESCSTVASEQTPASGRPFFNGSILPPKSPSRATNGQTPLVRRDASSEVSELQQSNPRVSSGQTPPSSGHVVYGPPLPPKSYSRTTNGQMPTVRHDYELSVPQESSSPATHEGDTPYELSVPEESHSRVTSGQPPPLGREVIDEPSLPQKGYSRATREQVPLLGREFPEESPQKRHPGVTDRTEDEDRENDVEFGHRAVPARRDDSSSSPTDNSSDSAATEQSCESTQSPSDTTPARRGSGPLQRVKATLGKLVRKNSDSQDSRAYCSTAFDWLAMWIYLHPENLKKPQDAAPGGGFVMVMYPDGTTRTLFRTASEFQMKARLDRLLRTSIQDAVKLAEQLAQKDKAQRGQVLLGVWRSQSNE